MSLSPPNFFGLLDETNPVGTDSRTISDDQHRNILASMKQQAPNWIGAITATHGDMNLLAGYVAAGQKPMPGVGGTTVAWFYNLTVPVGWSLLVADNNLRNLCVASGGATPVNPGTIQGDIDPGAATLDTTVLNVSVDLPADTGGTVLTQGQLPNMDIQFYAENVSATSCAGLIHVWGNSGFGGPANVSGGGGYTSTDNQGTDLARFPNNNSQPHAHNIGGTASQTLGSGTGSTAAFNPRRAVGLMGTLNA